MMAPSSPSSSPPPAKDHPSTVAAAAAAAAKENTVFVRFIPPSANIRRHHLEDLFSQIGPIRKSSVIVPRPPKPARGGGGGGGGGGGDEPPPPPTSPYVTTTTTTTTEQENKPSSYGFIKYTTPQDATAAAAKLNHSTIRLSPTEIIKIRVERASDAAAAGGGKSPNKKKHAKSPESSGKKQQKMKSTETKLHSESNNNETASTTNLKENRLILRNLSFYAKESHVRQVLESQFGKIVEVHIPQVPGQTAAAAAAATATADTTTTDNNKDKKKVTTTTTTHRGFCFVTFEKPESARACLEAKDSIVIKKRPVTVASSLNKTMYENKKQQNQGDSPKSNDKKKKNTEKTAVVHDEEHAKEQSDDDHDDQSDGSSSDEDDDSAGSNDDDDDSDASQHSDDSISHDDDDHHEEKKDDGEEDDDDKNDHYNNRDETAVAERRALFVRNLPFDSTRHDLFELFHKFGYITGIFIVKDKETNIQKGTAFVSFRNQASVAKALEQARNDNKFVSQRDAAEKQSGGTDADAELSIKGRRVFISLALDKDTASTLVMEKASDKRTGKDRRNLYLKNEGRVDNENEHDTAWDDLPEQDKNKRGKAWSDKNTKLRSPIFFINPNRVSIRNLSKTVDEQELKKLCAVATKRGLDRGLVMVEDVIAHWRASGEITSRDIMDRVEAEGSALIVPFDEKNVKKQIPSVHIERDFTGSKKNEGPSRGFGFVEFENHIHALACLRELNNNTRYSADYVAGGQHAMTIRKKSHKRKKPSEPSELVGSDGQVKVPRLIVEFTVENRAKARQQADHRAQQQANRIKQKVDSKQKNVVDKKENKKGRGARQRERKRKGLVEEPTIKISPKAETKEEVESKVSRAPEPAPKLVKPPKRQKVDKEESRFDKLVASFEVGFAAEPDLVEAPKKAKKRWYEG